MKTFLAAVVAGSVCLHAHADVVPTNQNAQVILDRVLANRSTKDFSLKARLFVGREEPTLVEILVKNDAEESRTIYRAGSMEALIVQPAHGAPRFFLHGGDELKEAARMKKMLGSHFTFYDLGLPFLRWPDAKFLGVERVRGRDCFVIESTADGEPYARVKLWIEKEYSALLRTEAFDGNGNLVQRFAVTSFKRLGEVWIPRGLEASFVPPGQSLPNQEKSRLEVFEGNYDARLPAEWFSEERFGWE